MSLSISSKAQLVFCPQCGSRTERQEVPIARAPTGEPTRTNLLVECPEHGELFIK